jgi:hypothetical protein
MKWQTCYRSGEGHKNRRSTPGEERLPAPDVLAQEIVDDMQTALEQFSAVVEGLKE